MGRQRTYRYGWLAILAFLVCCWVGWSLHRSLAARELTASTDFTNPANYAAQQLPDEGYLPVADWSGRLILPERAAAEAADKDWVWLEVFTSPNDALIGQQLRLQWRDTPDNRDFLALVTRGIDFDEVAIASLEKGLIHPTRLNGWARVGPLQSLAGTRPQDDMVVALPGAVFRQVAGESVIEIDEDPIQIPERFYGLVQVLGPDTAYPNPTQCPGRHTCPSDYQQVQHYNPASRAFDGRVETVRIPQVPPTASGVFQSTPQDLAASPAGEAGWYIYGAQNAQGTFVVRAIAPRRLFQLQPQTTLVGLQNGLNYINFGNWRNTRDLKGTLQSVLIKSQADTESTPTWEIGDAMLVLHLFGGIGGPLAEPRSVAGTVTGHFAFGRGEVVRDPFTQEPQLQVVYDQVYSHNPHGIVAGRTLWAEYAGNLQRGWLGTRPIADGLVNIPALRQTYQFGDFTLSPLAELHRQLEVMMARYRTGDGTGAAIVTPAQSCVQDSSQALYETIQVLRSRVSDSPQAQAWLASHSDDRQTALFEDLISLGKRLQGQLVPLGIARPDWRDNATVLTGIDNPPSGQNQHLFSNTTSLGNNLLSWRTVIPRVAYDNIAAILLEHGGELWFLRTNQIGGDDPTILPLAPTELFGEFVVIPVAFSRLIESLKLPDVSGIVIMLLGVGGFALALGLPGLGKPATGTHPIAASSPDHEGNGGNPTIRYSPLSLKTALVALVMPALWQELVFRVLLLPHPTEGVKVMTLAIWSAISLAIFVVYRGMLYRYRQPQANHCLGWYESAVLGMIATVVYLTTGSLWAAVGLHWGAWMVASITPIAHSGNAQRLT
jgi:predicted Abi (CAAX) family protease